MRFALFFIAALMSTSGPALAGDIPENAQQLTVDDITSHAFIVNPDDDEEGVVRALGKPSSRDVKAVRNKYSDSNDEYVELHYDGLDVGVFTYIDSSHGWSKVSLVSVSNNKWQLPHGLKLGMTANSVSNVLGPPHLTQKTNDGAVWIYYPSDEEPHLSLLGYIAGNVLTKFEWSFLP